jgi:RNA polymerase-binding transcription factor DksA
VTKEEFLKEFYSYCEDKGLEIPDTRRKLFEWVGGLVEWAYNEGFENGRESEQEIA